MNDKLTMERGYREVKIRNGGSGALLSGAERGGGRSRDSSAGSWAPMMYEDRTRRRSQLCIIWLASCPTGPSHVRAAHSHLGRTSVQGGDRTERAE
jgi:hypothetical protein